MVSAARKAAVRDPRAIVINTHTESAPTDGQGGRDATMSDSISVFILR